MTTGQQLESFRVQLSALEMQLAHLVVLVRALRWQREPAPAGAGSEPAR